jgi:hypothetical protein
MNIRPKDLNIPLKKKDFFNFWFFIVCLAFAIYSLRPDTLVAWAVVIFLAWPTFWFVLLGPAFLNQWAKNHRYFYPSLLVLALKLAVYYLVFKYLAPLAITLISQLAYAPPP